MNADEIKRQGVHHATFLMAIHSSSETLGVAALDLRNPTSSLRQETFPIGRELSNKFLGCVEKVLPSSDWPKLKRLAVATGPGGFTSTRITVVMARTLAQQIGCPLDGISSFALMAPRLASALKPHEINQPFWVIKNQPRRGEIGGQYQLSTKSLFSNYRQAIELQPPRLLEKNLNLSPKLNALDDVGADILHLLEICKLAHKSGRKSPWNEVLPLYPTSPVSNN